MKYKFIKYSKWVIFLLIFPTWLMAAIYQKTDAAGELSFSDTSTPDAVSIALPPANIYVPVTQISQKAQPKAQPKAQTKTEQKIAITAPNNQQTFHNQQDIPVAVQVENKLHPNDKIAWWLDGKFVQQTSARQTTLTIDEPGEHTLQAKLIDADKKMLLESQTVTFYLHRSVV